MILGLLPDVSNVGTLLSNLSEADFDVADVSVIMKDVKQRNAVARDRGPLKGATMKNLAGRLIQAGLSEDKAKLCTDALAQGQVLIAMAVSPESEPAAKEMLQDHSAKLVEA